VIAIAISGGTAAPARLKASLITGSVKYGREFLKYLRVSAGGTMPHAIKPTTAAFGVHILFKMGFETIQAISAAKKFRQRNRKKKK
jgi:hypothetical protein